MANLTIEIKQGGLGRTSQNTDSYVSMVAGLETLPGGVTSGDTITLFKIEDLEDLGFTKDSATDDQKALWYHVNEFFTLSPTARMSILFSVANVVADVDEVETLLQFDNKARVMGYFNWAIPTNAVTDVSALNTKLESLTTLEKLPIRLVYSFNQDGLVYSSALDFSSAENDRVMVDIAQDLTVGSLPLTIFTSANQCGSIGSILGVISNHSVHQKISWVEKGNLSANGGYQTLGFGNGDSAENLTQTAVDDLLNLGLTFVRKYPRSTNAYLAGSRMANDTTRDYAIINNGRTMDKAYGLVYDALLPDLDRPIYVNQDGTLAVDSIVYLNSKAYDAIQNNMVAGLTGNAVELSINSATGRLSDDSVYINPNQNVLANEVILIEIRLTPVGAAKSIKVEIGFVNPAIITV